MRRNFIHVLAARRRWDSDGTASLALVNLKTGRTFYEKESILGIYGVVLGDYLKARLNDEALIDLEKVEFPFDLPVEVEGDVVYVENVKCELIKDHEYLVFWSSPFAHAICHQVLPRASYTVRINLLDEPMYIRDHVIVYFEGTNPKSLEDVSPSISSLSEVSEVSTVSGGSEGSEGSESSTGPSLFDLPAIPPRDLNGDLIATFEETKLHITDQKFLFAARRFFNASGSPFLVCISLTTSEHFGISEETLKAHNIHLGDFLHAHKKKHATNIQFKKAAHTSRPKITVQGDLAYIHEVRVNLKRVDGKLVFQSNFVTDILCKEALELKMYRVKINLLPQPLRISPSRVLFFEGRTDLQSSESVESSFDAGNQKSEILTALVIDFTLVSGVRTHHLWVIDKKSYGTFTKKGYELNKGRVFKGNFVKENQNYRCQEYLQKQTRSIEGGLDEKGEIWLKVTVKNYKAPGPKGIFGHAEAKNIGKIIDIYSKLSSGSNGVDVQIQRKEVWEGEHQWVVTAVFRDFTFFSD